MRPEHLKESDEAFLKNSRTALGKLSKLLKKAEKLAMQRQETLLACRNWQEVKHEGDLLQANIYRIQKGMHEIAVSDWQRHGQERIITLNPRFAPHIQASQLFKRSKKLRLGEPHAERMLRLAHDNIQLLQQQLQTLENISTSDELAQFCQASGIELGKPTAPVPAKKSALPKPYRVFLTQSGMQIWVGKSAKNNDQLTFQCAKGSDWWLHARDYPGSHVVLRTAKNQEPAPADIQDAAELALRFSKAPDTKEGVVSISHVKCLVRIKGSPGKVLLPKHKTVHICLEDERWERLKRS